MSQGVGAMHISEFCRTYGICRTLAYEMIAAGTIEARKCSRRTLIDRASAETSYRALPLFKPARRDLA